MLFASDAAEFEVVLGMAGYKVLVSQSVGTRSKKSKVV